MISSERRVKGFTILEVIISGVLFALVAVGAIAAVAALKQPVATSREDINAAYLGKQILEQLRSYVDADDWNDPTNKLDPNGGPGGDGVYNHLTPVIIDGVSYTYSYKVRADPATNARRVDLTITW
jgi:Tfp pilus assembly protein PilV